MGVLPLYRTYQQTTAKLNRHKQKMDAGQDDEGGLVRQQYLEKQQQQTMLAINRQIEMYEKMIKLNKTYGLKEVTK